MCRHRRSPRIVRSIPEIHLDITLSPNHDRSSRDWENDETTKSLECMKVIPADDGGIHVFADQGGRAVIHRADSDIEVRCKYDQLYLSFIYFFILSS